MSDSAKSAPKNVVPIKPAPLGRGLSALFGDADAGYQPPAAESGRGTAGARAIPVGWLRPGQFQPRTDFDETALQELAESIRAHGVLQPLLVRPLAGERDRFEIIAGERRWRAAQIAGVHEVPVLVRDFDDKQTMEIALIENIQREDLSPLEEGEAYRRLIEEFNHKQEVLAKIVGKSRSHISNMMRLLQLPASVKTMVAAGEISYGHARALLSAADPEALARAIAAEKLSVRETEEWLRKPKAKSGAARLPQRVIDADIIALEKDLTNQLGLKVKIAAAADGSGTLTVVYKDADQLEGLLDRLR